MDAMRLLAACLLAALLAGCPAFYVERGGFVSPAGSLAAPAVEALPPPGAYVDGLEAWQRTARIGVGGYATATLVDPRLAAAEVSHSAALQTASGAAKASLLENRWATYYGPQRDRFPIELEWRFDEQFVRASRILDPDEWTFTLVTSDGARLVPLQTSTVEAGRTPKEGFWEGKLRLFFPWRQRDGRRTLGGQVSWIRLELEHRTGDAEFTWRFRPEL